MNQEPQQPSSLQDQGLDADDDMDQLEDSKGNNPSSLNPLQMNEIMNIILNFCDVPTLKTARLVSKLWNSESIPKLYRLAYFTVPPNFYSKTKKEQQSSISHMKKFLSTHPHVLLPNIQVLCYRDVLTLKNFNQSGNILYIRKLRLGYNLYDSLQYLKDFVDPMKNLQVLDTRPTLTNVFPSHEEYVFGNISQNLMKICAALEPRVITLTELKMIYGLGENRGYIDKLQHFSTLSNVRIQELFFCVFPCSSPIQHFRDQLADTLSNILERNKDEMTSLKAMGSAMYLVESRVPIMPRLQHFEWSVWPPCGCHSTFIPPKYSLPPDFQFSINFPNMKDMSLLYDNGCSRQERENGPQFWDFYFADQRPVSSLKTLSYCDHGHNFNLSPILCCFPELEEFELSHPGDLTLAAESIFIYGKNLKTLKLNINLDDFTTKISSFDEIFTGFSPKTVFKIRSRSKDWDVKELLEDGRTLDELCVHPSLLDLPHLELLKISIIGNVMKHLPRKMLFVTGKCAYHLMPKLQVNIDTKKYFYEKRLKTVLEEVSEFSNVTIF